MLNTGQKLIEWARKGDSGVRSFSSLMLANLSEMLLPYYRTMLQRAKNFADRFAFFLQNCALSRLCSGRPNVSLQCN